MVSRSLSHRLGSWLPVVLVALSIAPRALGQAVSAPSTAVETPSNWKPPNILFIMIDDLRPELGCYGHEQIHSPHLDRFAQTSIQFNRAYCMVPTCGASRASLMTGLRPHPTRFVRAGTRIGREAPRVLPLHTCLRQAGYTTVSLGKVIHHPEDHQNGWSLPPWRPTAGIVDEDDPPARGRGGPNPNWAGPAFAVVNADDMALVDREIAARAEVQLAQLADRGEPFFLAVGFIRPHLPFVAPQESWNLYDPEKLVLPDHATAPAGIPMQALHNSQELRNYKGIPATGPFSDELARQLIHGYYASVSFVDAQVGIVLEAVDRLGLRENTIVVVWGDHGWNLGEHSLWCKHCCFETSMHIPLFLRVPGKPQGLQVDGLVETIDLYPTLCELAGVSPPSYLHGKSFARSLSQPETIGKGFAVGRFGDGDTLRTAEYRYSEYRDLENGRVSARMLFDHRRDPDELENLANRPEYRQVVEVLSRQLHQVIDPLPTEVIPPVSARPRRGR